MLELLDKAKIPYVIAGGYARDTFFGYPPKDCDVWIDFKYLDEVQDILEDEMHPYQDCGENYDQTNNSKHIQRVLKVTDIDLIFVDIPGRIHSIVDYFDFNLNQFIMHGERPMYVGTTPIDKLVQLHPDLKDDRILKVYKKYQRLIKDAKI